MKSSELRSMNIDELRAKEGDLRKELFNLKIQHSTGQAENPLRLRHLRRDVARAKTIVMEKEREGANE